MSNLGSVSSLKTNSEFTCSKMMVGSWKTILFEIRPISRGYGKGGYLVGRCWREKLTFPPNTLAGFDGFPFQNKCSQVPTISIDTVDGRSPAPVDR